MDGKRDGNGGELAVLHDGQLPSEANEPSRNFFFQNGSNGGGAPPAYAAGNNLSMNTAWFRGQLTGEAKGCVVHELVHIVQSYGRATAAHPRPALPRAHAGLGDRGNSGLHPLASLRAAVEGRGDHGGKFGGARYDGSYRISANFLNWVEETHDEESIRKLNAAAREGNYSDKVWKDSAGKSAAGLGDDWKAANAQQLGL